MTIQKRLAVTSLLLVGAGLAMVAPVGLSLIQQRQAAAMSPVAVTVSAEQSVPVLRKEAIQGIPRSIAIPSLGIDISVEDGFYDQKTGQWTLSEEAAFYATPTLPVNSEGGNTLIYGHNSNKIFGKLLDIQPGSEVIVTTDNDYVFTYVYQSTEAVSPTDISPLVYEGAPRLTLQTCSGIWNQTRQMVYFELKDYRKR
jgi:LPXTG-site transpeptidase (sortase) family protein